MAIQVRSTFDEAAGLYQAAANAWSLAAESLRDAQLRLRTSVQTLEDIGLTMRLDSFIDGKNAETRAAQLRQLQLGDNDYLQTESAIEDIKRDVQRWQDECSTARDNMALYKRQMDWSIAYIHFQAEKGGESNDDRN